MCSDSDHLGPWGAVGESENDHVQPAERKGNTSSRPPTKAAFWNSSAPKPLSLGMERPRG